MSLNQHKKWTDISQNLKEISTVSLLILHDLRQEITWFPLDSELLTVGNELRHIAFTKRFTWWTKLSLRYFSVTINFVEEIIFGKFKNKLFPFFPYFKPWFLMMLRHSDKNNFKSKQWLTNNMKWNIFSQWHLWIKLSTTGLVKEVYWILQIIC